MKKTLHIVLDANKPDWVAANLRELWKETHPTWTVRHETDVAKGSSGDPDWIGKLKHLENEGDWLVITSDAGKNTKKEADKLPIVCKRDGHAYLIVSQNASKIEHLQAALVTVSEEFTKVVLACRKLRRARHPHPSLCRADIKGGAAYRVHISGKSLDEYLNPSTPTQPVKNKGKRQRQRQSKPLDQPSLFGPGA